MAFERGMWKWAWKLSHSTKANTRLWGCLTWGNRAFAWKVLNYIYFHGLIWHLSLQIPAILQHSALFLCFDSDLNEPLAANNLRKYNLFAQNNCHRRVASKSWEINAMLVSISACSLRDVRQILGLYLEYNPKLSEVKNFDKNKF